MRHHLSHCNKWGRLMQYRSQCDSDCWDWAIYLSLTHLYAYGHPILNRKPAPLHNVFIYPATPSQLQSVVSVLRLLFHVCIFGFKSGGSTFLDAIKKGNTNASVTVVAGTWQFFCPWTICTCVASHQRWEASKCYQFIFAGLLSDILPSDGSFGNKIRFY